MSVALAEAPLQSSLSTRSGRTRRVMEALSIRTKEAEIRHMKFTAAQEVLWKYVGPSIEVQEPLRFIVLKGRQVGTSTFFQGLTFVMTMASPNIRSLVVAHDLDTSHSLFEMSKRFYEHLAMPKLRDPKVSELVFPFRAGESKYKVVSAGSLAKGRGTTQTCLHLSEVAYWPHHEVYGGLIKALPSLPGTLCTVESTPNGMAGMGSLFYQLWNSATRGESDYVPIFIPWYTMLEYRRNTAIQESEYEKEEELLVEHYDLDGHQIAWRRWAIANLCEGEERNFNRDFPDSPEVAFTATGMSAFDRAKLLAQRANVCEPKMRGDFVEGKLFPRPKGFIRIYKDPVEGHQYVIGADVAEGVEGGDYSSAQVLDMDTMEQVACGHGHIQPYEYAHVLADLGLMYNKAIVAIEVYPNGFGVQDTLIQKYHYANLHRYQGKPDKVSRRARSLYGWETNVWSRMLLVEAGQRALTHDGVIIHEEGLIAELLMFTKNDSGKYEAEEGNDDRVMAFLIALRSRIENYIPRKKKISTDISAEDNLGVRTLPDVQQRIKQRHQLSKELRAKVKQSMKTWMEM